MYSIGNRQHTAELQATMSENNSNPYHAQHIIEFCNYANAGDTAIIDSVTTELMNMNQQIITL